MGFFLCSLSFCWRVPGIYPVYLFFLGNICFAYLSTKKKYFKNNFIFYILLNKFLNGVFLLASILTISKYNCFYFKYCAI